MSKEIIVGKGGMREAQKGEGVGVHIADSLHCRAEANTTL